VATGIKSRKISCYDDNVPKINKFAKNVNLSP
jgi:hypothetical protein